MFCIPYVVHHNHSVPFICVWWIYRIKLYKKSVILSHGLSELRKHCEFCQSVVLLHVHYNVHCIILLNGIPPFYYCFSVNLARWWHTCAAQRELFVLIAVQLRNNCHFFFLLLQSRTPALVFEYVNNTDFKVSCYLWFFFLCFCVKGLCQYQYWYFPWSFSPWIILFWKY